MIRPGLTATCVALLLAACGTEGADVTASPRATTSPAPADTLTATRTAPAPTARAAARPRPTIVQRPIPYGAKRRRDMVAYAERHYGARTSTLKPRVIVEHFTANTSFAATFNTFAPNVRDPELHELPGTCSHFVVDRDGTIYQLVPIARMCRHTVGLNSVAIGIEHVGMSDGEVMGNARQRTASLRLTAWLRCREGIAIRDVIGHNENVGHRLHRERVARLRTQTHADFAPATSRRYRALLRSRPC